MNKNTKCPIDAHCHRHCRRDPRIGRFWSGLQVASDSVPTPADNQVASAPVQYGFIMTQSDEPNNKWDVIWRIKSVADWLSVEAEQMQKGMVKQCGMWYGRLRFLQTDGHGVNCMALLKVWQLNRVLALQISSWGRRGVWRRSRCSREC